ncbi:MAG: hypothetical protein K2Y39_13470 [Candidatus Obscuribacterales bacterium]|nr:hypothetical protein [Candidatus Obscuribacterales bacterium]
MQRHSAHAENIVMVAHRLERLETEVVFTGGAIVGLLLTDIAAPDVRPTDDVAVIVGITRYFDYASLQEQLRKIGFKHDMNGPNCRFILDGLKVGVMPSEGKVLGFTNRWYDFALASANVYLMPDGTSIKLISAPAFVATKLEAFHARGLGQSARCVRGQSFYLSEVLWCLYAKSSCRVDWSLLITELTQIK